MLLILCDREYLHTFADVVHNITARPWAKCAYVCTNIITYFTLLVNRAILLGVFHFWGEFAPCRGDIAAGGPASHRPTQRPAATRQTFPETETHLGAVLSLSTDGSLIFDRVSEIASHYQYLGKVRSRRSLTPLPAGPGGQDRAGPRAAPHGDEYAGAHVTSPTQAARLGDASVSHWGQPVGPNGSFRSYYTFALFVEPLYLVCTKCFTTIYRGMQTGINPDSTPGRKNCESIGS